MRVRARSVAICLAVGFVLQLLILVWIIGHGLPDKHADLLGALLLPGVALFWAQGFHSDSAILGFVIGTTIDTIYFGTLLLGLSRVIRRSRSESP